MLEASFLSIPGTRMRSVCLASKTFVGSPKCETNARIFCGPIRGTEERRRRSRTSNIWLIEMVQRRWDGWLSLRCPLGNQDQRILLEGSVDATPARSEEHTSEL